MIGKKDIIESVKWRTASKGAVLLRMEKAIIGKEYIGQRRNAAGASPPPYCMERENVSMFAVRVIVALLLI